MGANGSKCDEEPTMRDGKVVFGENVCESDAAKDGAYSPFKLIKLPPPVLCVFDNKSDVGDQPKLGIVQNGVAIPIMDGDSEALREADMESISLVDASKGLYVAAAAMGAIHVFTLHQVEGTTKFKAMKVATGLLPVPEGESTESWQDANRTNIEAVRCKTVDGQIMIGWASRGGENYANMGTSPYVWIRWAPFDPTTATVDESKMEQTTLKNVGENDKWRAISAMDMSDGYLYFTSAYDGEEDGHPMDVEDAARVSDANKAAMKSLIGRASLATGKTEVLMRLEGLKLEAITVFKDTDKRVKCLIASDDEGMGSLIGVATFKDLEHHLEPKDDPLLLIDVAKSSSFYAVEQKRWGTSGIALLHLSPEATME